MHAPVRHRRSRAVLSTAVAVSGALGALAPAPAGAAVPESPGAVAPALKPPRVVGEACGGRTGVTVVVDFRNLHARSGKVMNTVEIGCARGAQADGLAALEDAGFTLDLGNGFVCEIDNRPLPVDSVCASNGYWSYSHGERGEDWEYATTGAGDWQPPAGSLEGWSWSPYDRDGWDTPRVTPRDLFPALAADAR